MPRLSPVGMIVLQPDAPNSLTGVIDFVSLQDPTQPDPKKSRMAATNNEWVSWIIQNNFDEPDDITVTLVFDWKGNTKPPFKKNLFSKKVNDLSDSKGPGYAEIKAKVEKDATYDTYKFTIIASLNGIPNVDPVLEIDDGSVLTPP